jgi:hypothetical protein
MQRHLQLKFAKKKKSSTKIVKHDCIRYVHLLVCVQLYSVYSVYNIYSVYSVYSVYNVYNVYTHCTHMPNVYNFGVGTAVSNGS